MGEPKATGAVCEISPMRIYNYETVSSLNATVVYPTKYQLSADRIGVVKNQGQISCCVGCVLSSLAEVLDKIENNEFVQNDTMDSQALEFSEGWIYGALRDKNDTIQGMYPTVALNYWKKYGALPKKYFNILEEMPNMKTTVNKFPELYNKAEPYKIVNYMSLKQATASFTDKAIKQAIFNNQYGLVGISDRYFGGSHCIMIIGWNDATNSYIVKNSWGKNWGKNGVAEIPKSAINFVYMVTDKELKLPFTDVLKTDWYYSAIKHMYFSGLIKGISSTKFAPIQNMTRAELATIIDRLIQNVDERIKELCKIITVHKKKRISNTNNFMVSLDNTYNSVYYNDVNKKDWCYSSVLQVSKLGLMNGIGQNQFAPDANVTRAEISTILSRINLKIAKHISKLTKELNISSLKYKYDIVVNKADILSYSDVTAKHWAYGYILYSYQIGLMNGFENNTFKPEAYITRAEIATVFNRFNKYIEDRLNKILDCI